MSWKLFEDASPALASLVFERLNRKIAYLATLRRDGSPRLHPVTPFIGSGMLFIFTEPSSPKIRDLRRDSRYALHCSVGGDGPLIEVLVSGNVEVVSDPAVRAQALDIAHSPVPAEDYVLFDFQIAHVLVVSYDEHKNRTVQRWGR